MRETRIFSDPEALARAACGLLMELIGRGLEERGRAVVALSGGNTPRETYRLLASGLGEARTPVDGLQWIFADERWVPVSHPDSNEGMIRGELLDAIAAPESTIASWEAGAGDPPERAAIYARRLRSILPGTRDKADAIVLGIGADGHTASLFPGSRALLPGGKEGPVSADMPMDAASVLPGPGRGWRLTLCPRFLNTARCAIFLVSGSEKRESLGRVLERDPLTPASWIDAERTLFLVTRDAIGKAPVEEGRGVRFARAPGEAKGWT
jgi:6-phosphogluconolactonase